ncbi:hypothetical protein BU26DRAFT_503051 [Trematosphaeria pertusa]|uniref:BTB domain-containing protein n=1 Tax=Trematosphaeria pertusa TaxID=390896 RepID=A0A6A6IQ59_9PLEO|nr:uncharacterized protein BU26DRAFT_503051 [Trematosphaeria pertusa]KAF2252601.1 hypothetical protein BU26DRAFT_503051 [Trematosphaeria pertusa]
MSEPRDTRIPNSDAADLWGPVVKIIIKSGDNKQIINVHKALLCSSSAFFQKATKPEWASSRDDPDAIEVESALDIFQSYVHWFYKGTIPRPSTRFRYTDHVFLAALYTLGEELTDTKFKNAVVDTMIYATDK